MSELILRDDDMKKRFEASLHDKELPHSIYSVGKSLQGKDNKTHLREKKALQRQKMMRAQYNANNSR